MIHESVVCNFQVFFAQRVPSHQCEYVFAVQEHFVAEGAVNHDVERHNRDDNVLEDDQIFDCKVLFEIEFEAEKIAPIFVPFLAFKNYGVVLSGYLVVHLHVTHS